MKFLKLYESWYKDYSYAFSDRGFDIKDSSTDGNKIIWGNYKGKYILTDLNDDFIEMILRMSDHYDILKTKTYFNQATGNASFEVEVSDKIDVENFIEVDTSDGVIKWFPIKVVFISNGGYKFYGEFPLIRIIGKLESGISKELLISKKYDKIKTSLSGYVTKNPKINNENLLKLFNMIDSGLVELDYIDKYDKFKKIIIDDNEK
jgi:hypothetical protein